MTKNSAADATPASKATPDHQCCGKCDSHDKPKSDTVPRAVHERSLVENANLRKLLLWAYARMSSSLKVQFSSLVKAPLEAGGVARDKAADDRRLSVNRDKAFKALADHVQSAVLHGADDRWIARADILASQATGYLVPYEEATFHEVHHAK